MISFKEYLTEGLHPELKAMGATKQQVDLFKKYKKADAEHEKHDPEHIPRGVKVARTRALRSMHDGIPQRIIHKMHMIHDLEGSNKLDESLDEGKYTSSEPMSPEDMQKNIDKSRFNAVIKHPWFKQYFQNKNIAMQYHKTDTGLDHMVVGHGNEGGLRRRAEFHFNSNGRKIENVHLAHNRDDEKHNGKLVWRHIKSEKEV